MEDYFVHKETRNLYREVKQGQKKCSNMTYCKSKDGQLLGNLDERLERQADYFQETVNEDEQHNITQFQDWELIDQSMQAEYPQPGDEEIKKL